MKDVKNYENYEVTESGKVFSKLRVMTQKNGKVMTYPRKQLKPDIAKTKHQRVTLCKKGKTKRFLVHRLVAIAYLPNTYNKPHINHIDNNPSNNNLINLEWVTHSENMLHAQKQGRLTKSQAKGGRTKGATEVRYTNEINNMIGKTFSVFKVEAYGGYSDNQQKHYLKVSCVLCGNESLKTKTYIKLSKNTRCMSCNKIKI